MCHISCIVFGAKSLLREEIAGQELLEVGSYDVNGTLRPILEAWGPKTYVGVDIMAGPGVDVVCPAEKLVEHFGDRKFDVVVTTEMLEHVRDWQAVISNLKNMTKPGGILLATTRSYGMAYHAYPYDFWRYEKEDMEEIFKDFEILEIEKDPMTPGIFVKARRPMNFQERDLSQYKLYSIVTDRKMTHIEDADYNNPHFRKVRIRMFGNQLISKVETAFRSVGKSVLRLSR